MCKPMMAEPGFMEKVSWENHTIAGGMLSITKVAPDFKASWGRVCTQMEKTGQKLAAGEQLPLCNHCKSYGGLIMAGAQEQSIESDGVYVNLLTSIDPAVVAKIQAHARRTIDEYAKWEKGNQPKKSYAKGS